MADVSQNIVLTAVGGDASATEINKSSQALNSVTSSSSALQTKFQERFQHIGLQLFARQSLGSIGLSGEVRQAVMLMNTALTGAEEAAGISSGGITLLITALAALVAIAYKVSEAHKDMIVTLNAAHDAQEKGITTTDASVASLNAYIKAGGAITPALQAWLNAENAVRAAQIARQEATDKQIISTLQATIAQEKLNLAVTQSIKPEDLKYLEDVSAGTKQAAESMGMLKKSVDAQSLALQTNQAQLSKTEVEYNNLKRGVTANLADITSALDKQNSHERQMMDIKIAAYQDHLAAQRQMVDDENAHELAIMDDHVQNFVAAKQAETKEQAKELAKQQAEAKKVADVIGNNLGAALAKTLVEGKNFSAEMSQMFTKMAELFIEKVVEMAIEWAVLQVVMDVWPGGAEAYQATAQAAYPAVAQATYKSIGKQASGGSYLASSPTVAIFGEAGPETATFTPLGGSSSSGGSSGPTTINISMNVDHIEGNNPEDTLNQLSDAIRQQTVAGRIFATTVAGIASKYPNQAY